MAEQIVEEWLNRQGYFTIRGIKMGVHEIDMLAIRHLDGPSVECRHLEIQASMRPVSYISKVPKKLQKMGRAANSAKRSDVELRDGIKEWVEKKFFRKDKRALMANLWPGTWSSELVINIVKSDEEVQMIEKQGVKIIRLKDIIHQLRTEGYAVQSAAGADFIDLINMDK